MSEQPNTQPGEWSTCHGRAPWTEQELVRMLFRAMSDRGLAAIARLVMLSLWSRRDAEGAVCARLVPVEQDTGLDRHDVIVAFELLRRIGWLRPFKRFDDAGAHDFYALIAPTRPS